MKRLSVPAVLALWALPMAVGAQSVNLDFGRYLARYPAMYAAAGLSYDARDEIFDAQGETRGSAAPTYGAGVAFPETRASTQLQWFFPFFETEAIPLISSRLWTARAEFGYARSKTEGAGLKSFIAANDLQEKGDGLADVQLEFGPVLYGSQDWRTRQDTPLSVLMLAGLRIPIGERDPDAPNNVGSNAFAWHVALGAHWRPFSGWFVDLGGRWRSYASNQESAFGGHEPSRQGDDLSVDLSVAARLIWSVYASASLYARRGDDNEYSNSRFANNPPPAGLLMETFPQPGSFRDGGTRELRLDLGAHWFITQRLLATLHYTHPLSGESGEFDLPYVQQLQNCAALGGCNPQANGSAHVDGLGPARVYASDHFMLGLQWNFKQGDFWLGGW
jgi:opacity protein-like surface antigen